MDFVKSKETNEKNESSEERLERIQAEKKYLQDFKKYLEDLKEDYSSEETSEGEDDENPDPPEKKLVKRLEFRGKTR